MVREYKAPSNDYWQPDDKSGEYVVIYPDGTKYWYKNGNYHRDGGPSIEHDSGTKEWYVNGKQHREDGPAIERHDGSKYYFYKDKRYYEIQSNEEWISFIKMKFLW